MPARLGLLPPPQNPDELEAWYLNRAPYDRGPLGGATWQGELDRAVLWLDALPYEGRIVELGAGIEKKVVDFAAEVAAQTKTH